MKPEVQEDVKEDGAKAEAVKEEGREEGDKEVQIPATEEVTNEGVIQEAMECFSTITL